MNDAEMRHEILKVYPNWKEIRLMPVRQIYAIYNNMVKRGSFDQPKEPVWTDKVEGTEYRQLNFFDIWDRDEIIESKPKPQPILTTGVQLR